MNITQATIKMLLENKETDILNQANIELKNVKTSKELIALVDNYLNDKFNIGYPIYLISKRSKWCLYDGEIIDNTKAVFMVSDSISHKIVDIKTAYKYYMFSDRCR